MNASTRKMRVMVIVPSIMMMDEGDGVQGYGERRLMKLEASAVVKERRGGGSTGWQY